MRKHKLINFTLINLLIISERELALWATKFEL